VLFVSLVFTQFLLLYPTQAGHMTTSI